MIERLIKWVAFSIGLTILPVLLSIIFKSTFKIDINIEDYTNEFIFMAVTLSATSIGDLVSLIKKRCDWDSYHCNANFFNIYFTYLYFNIRNDKFGK